VRNVKERDFGPTSATEPSVQLDHESGTTVSADRPQTAALVIKPFQTVAEDIFT